MGHIIEDWEQSSQSINTGNYMVFRGLDQGIYDAIKGHNLTDIQRDVIIKKAIKEKNGS